MTGDSLVFPWARSYDADQLAAFLDDLWGAAGNGDDLTTLDAIEEAIAAHRPEPPACPLTERQLDVLTQLANGGTHDSTARALSTTPHAVRNCCTEIYARLCVRNAVQAVAVAAHHGWLSSLHVPALLDGPPAHGPAAWRVIYREAVARMRKQPGVPVDIGPYGSYSGARNAVWRIRNGLLAEVQPAGDFAAQAIPTGPGQFIVRARYIGAPNTAERAAS